MIDFMKAEIHGPSVTQLINHPLLNFKAEFEVKTGETKTETQKADYQNLKFIIKDNRYINLQGSLHKYHSNGINYNDFTMGMIRSTLANLTDEFEIDLSRSNLHNLEYGVNVILPYNPMRIIANLINHKGETFEKMYGEARRSGKQSVKQQYTLKIYNKGQQCNLSDFVLRVEMKVIKMKYLERYSISTLADLSDQEKMKCLMNDLSDAFNEVLMYDPGINLKRCSESEKELLKTGRYSEYWKDLKEEKPKMHDYSRRRFRQLTQKYGQNYQEKVSNLIDEKAKFLLRTNEPILAKLTGKVVSEFGQYNCLSGMLKRQVKVTKSDTATCIACGMQILNRHHSAAYCSEACRIKAKNRRRDVKRPLIRSLTKLNSNPTLFNTSQYLMLSMEQREISKMYGLYDKLISA